jgi:cellulose synthase/poly-beta-1,6-N-acetylglucosamine synthase-like glycosyltransferase
MNIIDTKQIVLIPSQSSDSLIGAGVIHNGRTLITHTRQPIEETALKTLVLWQKIALTFCLSLLALGIIFKPLLTATLLVAFLTFIYFSDLVFSLILMIKSLSSPPELTFSLEELSNIDERELPVYSVLCPLYKEAKVLPQFVEAMSKIDWPKDRLEILLLLEEGDEETIAAAEAISLPEHIKTIIVPASQPKTKPKACNYGLSLATGEYLVIYDAEDRPETDQLKKAYLGFKRVGKEVVCLQAKLNYYNPNQNLLTKLFTAEYSLWFDLTLLGLQSINTVIPLGGTSNHFRINILRKLGGWDPFNVTEDCDLGVRLFKYGYKTSIIQSTTYEEANSNFKNWLRQRSRWIKGYWQTYLVHMRSPLTFLKKSGKHFFVFQLVMGARMTFMLINPFLWLITISYFVLNPLVGDLIETIYIPVVFYPAVFTMVFGNFLYIYNYMIGCAIRKKWDLIKYVYFIPVYWLAAFWAAMIAFYQLLVKPHFWEKTHHGLHLNKQAKPKEELEAALVNVETVKT